MADDNQPRVNRRKVLKKVGVSAGAVAGGSGVVTASSSSRISDPLDNRMVSTILAEIGNPDPDEIREKSVTAEGGHPKVNFAEIETGVGTLRYVEADEEIDGKSSTAYIVLSHPLGRGRNQVPSKYRLAPPNSDLILVYEDGGVSASRTAVRPEKVALEDISGVSADDMIATYNEDGGYFKIIDKEKGGTVLVEVHGDVPSINEFAVPVLQRREVTVTRPRDGITIQENHCWDLGWFFLDQGPCVACVQTGAVAAACAGVCSVTGGVGCIPCIASIGFAGGACGCCLDCVDHVDAPPDGC